MGAKKKPDNIPADKLALYDKLIKTNPTIERKGATVPYTSVNGNMFTLFSPNGLVGIRLPKDQRDAFLARYKTTLYETYGATMKEYVTVPDELLSKTSELRKYLDLSYEYAKSLKPKPTSKKKTS